jgi:hypothetical protein
VYRFHEGEKSKIEEQTRVSRVIRNPNKLVWVKAGINGVQYTA